MEYLQVKTGEDGDAENGNALRQGRNRRLREIYLPEKSLFEARRMPVPPFRGERAPKFALLNIDK